MSETVGSTTTKFLVDDKNPTGYSQVLDELVNGAVTRTYTYGRQRISENQLINGTWTPSFYGYDGHSNVRFLASSAGTITDTYTFDAFGAPIASTGTTPNPYLYSGERFDSSLNLYHLRARDYNMLTGRFETMDPDQGNVEVPVSLHKYAYTQGNPVNSTDPTGRNMFETGKPLEIPTSVAPRAAAISPCVIAVLRAANYLWWDIGNVGPPIFSPIFCGLGGAPWAPRL